MISQPSCSSPLGHKSSFFSNIIQAVGYLPVRLLPHYFVSLNNPLVYQIYNGGMAVLVYSSKLLFYLIMAPKHKNNNAGNLDMPKRNCKEHPLCEKFKVLHSVIEEKKYHVQSLYRVWYYLQQAVEQHPLGW